MKKYWVYLLWAYLIFSLLFGYWVISSNVSERYVASSNPYYTEAINYPPAGTGRVALASFFVLSSIYLLGEYFFLKHFKGLVRGLITFLCVVLIWAGMEGACWWYVMKHPPLHRPHPVYLWEVFPNHHGEVMLGRPIRVDINRWGFRGKDVRRKKGENTYRIMIIGDSSAFGYGIDEGGVFSELLQRILQRRYPNIKIEVINAAVAGYTTYSSSLLFKDKLWKFHPDLLIVSHNNDPDMDWASDKDRASPSFIQPLMQLLYKSQVYMLFRKILLTHRISHRKYLYKTPNAKEGVHRVSIDDFRKNLERIFRVCKNRGIKVLVLSMPRREEEDYTLSLYRGVMEDVTEEKGGIFLDLFHRWQEEGAEDLFIDDMHPNEEGHLKIAKEIAEVIEKKRLIPSH